MLIFGGRSAEHDVSRVTAVSVARALDPDRYEVIPVAITQDGRWLDAKEAQALINSDLDLPQGFPVSGRLLHLSEPLSPSLASSPQRLSVSMSYSRLFMARLGRMEHFRA